MKQTVYRIYTESRPDLDGATQALVGEYFDGFTVIHGTGWWKGTREASLIIEVVATPDDAGRVAHLAKTIRNSNGQEAVLVTRHGVESSLI